MAMRHARWWWPANDDATKDALCWDGLGQVLSADRFTNMDAHFGWFVESMVVWALVHVCCEAVVARLPRRSGKMKTWGGVSIGYGPPSTGLIAALVYALATAGVKAAGDRGNASDAGFQRGAVFFLAFHVVAVAWDLFPVLRGGGGRIIVDTAMLRWPPVLYVAATAGTTAVYALLVVGGGTGWHASFVDEALWVHVDSMADHLAAPRLWVTWLLLSRHAPNLGYAALCLAVWGSAKFLASSAWDNWQLCRYYGALRHVTGAVDGAVAVPHAVCACLCANAAVCWVQAAVYITPRLYVWSDETLVRAFGLHAKKTKND